MWVSSTLLRKIEQLDPQLREVFLLFLEELEKQRQQIMQQVTKAEFQEVRAVLERLSREVAALAEAQKRTEQRVNELAEAQKRTEERLEALARRVDELAQRVDELAEAQKRTEERLEALARRVDELAEAQKRTEERLEALARRVDELAEAQKRTEERLEALARRVDELAEAQKRTEEELRALARRVDALSERVEGLSNAVGYALEDKAINLLPALLEQRGVRVEGRLRRLRMMVRGVERQLNIFGYGYRDGQRVVILGEAKVRPSLREVQRFERLIQNVAAQEGLPVLPLFVVNDCALKVQRYLEEKGIWLFWSYELWSWP